VPFCAPGTPGPRRGALMSKKAAALALERTVFQRPLKIVKFLIELNFISLKLFNFSDLFLFYLFLLNFYLIVFLMFNLMKILKSIQSRLSARRERSAGQLGAVVALLPADLPDAPGRREDRPFQASQQSSQGEKASTNFRNKLPEITNRPSGENRPKLVTRSSIPGCTI
jgi:hypothetical protein